MSKKMIETQAANANTAVEALVIERRITDSALQKRAQRYAEAAGLYPVPLARYGWPEEKTTALQGQMAVVAQARVTQAEAKAASMLATANLGVALDVARGGRDRIAAAFRLLSVRGEPAVPLTFLKVTQTSRHPKLLLEWFGRARRYAMKWRGPLAVSLAVDPVERIDELRRDLLTAEQEADASRKATKERTVEVRKIQEGLVTSLDTLFLTARIAFRDDPATLKRFRKDSGKRKAAPAPQPAESKAA